MILSGFYCLSYIVLFLGLLFVKKSEKDQNPVIWLPIILFATLILGALFAGLFSLISIPVNLVSSSLTNVTIGAVFFFFIIKKKKLQRFRCEMFDILILFILFATSLACAFLQFGTSFELNYATSDPAAHLWCAMQIVETGHVSGMYLVHYIASLFIQAAIPFIGITNSYMPFIVAEVFVFFLSGAVLYSVVGGWLKSSFMKFCVAGLIVLYMLAYPFNNMLFGFGYLGMGVTSTILLIFALNLYLGKHVNRCFGLLLIMLGLLGLSISYSLFMPSVYLATFLVLLFHFRKEGKVFSKKTIFNLLIIFGLPAAFGLYYALFGMFGDGHNSVSGQLGREGYIYRDLYSNFVIIAPFILYALAHSIHGRKLSVETIFFLVNLAVMLVVFVLGITGKASSYYYYKFYYLMWPFAMMLAISGFIYLAEKTRTAVVSYCLVWILIMLFAVSGIDQKLNENYYYYNPQVRSWSYLDIYHFNLDQSRMEATYGLDAIELAKQADVLRKNNDSIPVVGKISDVYWYEAITNQNLEEYYPWYSEPSVYPEKLRETSYVTIMPSPEEPGLVAASFTDSEVVFSNGAGYIIKVR